MLSRHTELDDTVCTWEGNLKSVLSQFGEKIRKFLGVNR